MLIETELIFSIPFHPHHTLSVSDNLWRLIAPDYFGKCGVQQHLTLICISLGHCYPVVKKFFSFHFLNLSSFLLSLSAESRNNYIHGITQ
jgi:hypothetical protein